MRLLVDQLAVAYTHDLVDAVGELVAAILDVNARLAMVDIAAVDIGKTRHKRFSFPLRRPARRPPAPRPPSHAGRATSTCDAAPSVPCRRRSPCGRCCHRSA